MDSSDELLERFIRQGLAEDVGEGDHTSMACIRSTRISKAKLLVKDDGVISGIRVAGRIFREIAPAADFEILIQDGSMVSPGDIAFYVTCPTRSLLMGERLALNIMQRMSGISTLANLFAQEIEGLPVKILDTRKTTPGIRFLEKEAVRLGGCHNYRNGLYDWIMIKDNHVEASGGIEIAIDRVHEYMAKNNKSLPVTIEVRNLVELLIAVGKSGRYRLVEWPPEKKAIDIGDFYADSSLILRTLGWQPRMLLHEGLTRTIEYYRAHLHHYVTDPSHAVVP